MGFINQLITGGPHIVGIPPTNQPGECKRGFEHCKMQQVTLWPWKTFSANVIDAGGCWVEHVRWASIYVEKDVENLRFRENHICFSDFILDPPFVPLNMVFHPQKLSMFYHFWWYLIYVFNPTYGYKQVLGISQVITNINEPC